MDLHDAFIQFTRKYYEGFDYAANAKAHPTGKFQYDHKTLDKIHNEVVPKSSNPQRKDPINPPQEPDNGTNL
jgi:hypothetical protein